MSAHALGEVLQVRNLHVPTQRRAKAFLVGVPNGTWGFSTERPPLIFSNVHPEAGAFFGEHHV